MNANIHALAVQCVETFVQDLFDRLSDPKLQAQFDKNAIAKIESLGRLVRSANVFAECILTRYSMLLRRKLSSISAVSIMEAGR